jgi:GNAT superfamily N-acetyltransferase
VGLTPVGMTSIPSGHLATIVTDLEMRTRPVLRPMPDSRLRLIRWPHPDPNKYRILFERVGAPWLWFSRLVMAEDALQAILGDAKVEVYAVVDPAGIEVGMLELDFRKSSECEIAYFGLVPELTGGGHGRWLMAQTLARAWRPDVDCVWVHTCTLDHPSALGFYRAQGFTAINREIEIFADPRLIGVLPPDSAPQIPLLGGKPAI